RAGLALGSASEERRSVGPLRRIRERLLERRWGAVDPLKELALQFFGRQVGGERCQSHPPRRIEHLCAHDKTLGARAAHQLRSHDLGNFWQGIIHAKVPPTEYALPARPSTARYTRGRSPPGSGFSHRASGV